MSGHLYYWVANWSLSRAQASLLLGGDVADLVDCTGLSFDDVIATSIPNMALYVTGNDGIAASASQVDRAKNAGKQLLFIDQSNSPTLDLEADVHVAKDVETGASTIPAAMTISKTRIDAGKDYIIYCDQAVLDRVEQAAAAYGLPPGEIVAYQYASPTSNPATVLPGTGLTLRQANADLSVIDLMVLESTIEAAYASIAVLPYGDGCQWQIRSITGDHVSSRGHTWAALVTYTNGHWTVTPKPELR